VFENGVLLPKIGYLARSSGPFGLFDEFAEKGNPQIIHHISPGSEPSQKFLKRVNLFIPICGGHHFW
jgi:hypothetical protein